MNRQPVHGAIEKTGTGWIIVWTTGNFIIQIIKWYYEDFWFVTDFNAGFDHNDYCSSNNFKLYFETEVMYEYKLDLDGTFEFETKLHSQSLKGDKSSKTSTDDPQNPDLKKVLTDSKKFLEKVPSEKEMKKS